MVKKGLLRVVSFPGDVIGYFALFFIWLFLGEMSKLKLDFWVCLKSETWFVRTLYKKYRGTAFCHGGILFVSKEQEALVVKHESVHVEQFEVIQLFCFFGFLVSLGVSVFSHSHYPWIFSLAFWSLSWLLVNLSSAIVALLRDENPYRGSSLEEAAYAIVDEYTRKKEGNVSRGIK